jgi:hypothetical protein
VIGSETQSEIVTSSWINPKKRKLWSYHYPISISKVFEHEDFPTFLNTDAKWQLTPQPK